MLGNTALEINTNIANRFKLESLDLNIWLSVHNFFYNINNWNILLNFLKSNSKLSLRVIEYFLTTY